MTNAANAVLRHDASNLVQQFPEEMLSWLVGLMRGVVENWGNDGAKLREHAAPVVGADSEAIQLDGLPAVRGEPGIAAGEFVLPEDFDSDDEMIANLFEGRL
ncbi:MAG: hypothetical protein IKH84_00240 [Ottowia sp.]|nr:hypothetical protein [Ottowia sp.]MBR6975316.1 hypothetical protein [Ottowia sp.]